MPPRVKPRAPFVALALALGVWSIAAPGAAQADQLLAESVQADGVTAESCTSAPLDGPGVVQRDLSGPALGRLTARTSGGTGDWDLGVFDLDSGQTVAGSASFGADEVAGGYAFAGERLLVQACRRPGASASVSLDVGLEPAQRERAPRPPALLRVEVTDEADRAALTNSGLDLVALPDGTQADVVSHGPADERELTRLGLPYVTRNEDMAAAPIEARSARRAGARLPSGRSGTYRRLFDYSEEMKALAAAHPRLVRTFALPHRTYEGRAIEGIEITRNVGATGDGKPVFVQLGLHHAREWPSGEHTLEWAYELLDDYEAGEPRARRIVRHTRTVVVPVVNPDGFNASREAGELGGAGAGRGGASDEAVSIVAHPAEYRRKNCRAADGSATGTCLGPPEAGVDLNRNYAGFWGGRGAGTDPLAPDYRGPGPFSEPETLDVRALFSENSVTAFISNHTYADLILRPPGLTTQGRPVDDRMLSRLGARMAAHNGYGSSPGWGLYETTGTTEDWAYYATGSLGFTFEIGATGFHPPFGQTVNAWRGNRDAYYELAEFVADRASHSVIRGRGPRGGSVVASKSFATPTSHVLDPSGNPGPVLHVDDTLSATARIGPRGRFALHLNPSTRPLVAQDGGRERWTLTCSDRAGAVTGTRGVFIKRGARKTLDLRRC